MNLKFKQVGMIILESINGDIMFAMPAIKSEIIITARAISEAQEKQEVRNKIFNNFIKFLESTREARWCIVQRKFEKIAEKDATFASTHQKFFEEKTASNLRKLEKDIYFWGQNN